VIAAKSGSNWSCRVAVRDISKERPFPVELVTDDPMSVVERPDVQLVVEVMGGLEPARSLVIAALEAGKPVVSANKELIAAEGPACSGPRPTPASPSCSKPLSEEASR
jgi:homoserine dehydrogenase